MSEQAHSGARNGGARRTLVVAGNGMVGQRFCERLVARDTGSAWRVVVIGEEPRPAYDRVHLSEFFSGRTAADLALADAGWFAEHGIALRLGERVTAIDCAARVVTTDRGHRAAYDALVLATGSAPFVPAIPGIERAGVFVYRTIEDLEDILAWGHTARRAAVIGGGLLGLEAAKAVRDMGLETHVVEFAPRLMPRQVDAGGGEVLRRAIEALGVHVHVGVQTTEVLGGAAVRGLRFASGDDLTVDMVVVSAGIRPRDELARGAGLAVGERGGVVVSTGLVTSDPHVYCIGEAAVAGGMVYGLVGPGYEMADVLATRLCGGDAAFTGADLSTKLKLLGIEVASFGDPFADETLGTQARRVVFEDRVRASTRSSSSASRASGCSAASSSATRTHTARSWRPAAAADGYPSGRTSFSSAPADAARRRRPGCPTTRRSARATTSPRRRSGRPSPRTSSRRSAA